MVNPDGLLFAFKKRLELPLRGWLTPPAYPRMPFAGGQTSSSLVRAVFISNHNKKPPIKGGFCYGRNDWTRTSDLFVPNEAFYQAELHSE